KAPVLRGEIVDGTIVTRRIFESLLDLQIPTDDVVLHPGEAVRVRARRFGRRRHGRRAITSECTAIFHVRRDGCLRTPVKTDSPTVVKNVGTGRNINQANRAQPELGGERSSDERYIADEAAFQNAPETGDAVGEHDAIDPKLHVGVIVADMKQAA